MNISANVQGSMGIVRIGRFDFRLLNDMHIGTHESTSVCSAIERAIREGRARSSEDYGLITFDVRLDDGRVFTFRGAVPDRKLPEVLDLLSSRKKGGKPQ